MPLTKTEATHLAQNIVDCIDLARASAALNKDKEA